MCGTLPAVEGVRLDKWLWAARLVKTRGLAAEAIAGGRVHLNGARAKPSKEVRSGDRLEITVGQVRREVLVRGVAERRGPAREAQLLYEETPESIAERVRRKIVTRASVRGSPRRSILARGWRPWITRTSRPLTKTRAERTRWPRGARRRMTKSRRLAQRRAGRVGSPSVGCDAPPRSGAVNQRIGTASAIALWPAALGWIVSLPVVYSGR